MTANSGSGGAPAAKHWATKKKLVQLINATLGRVGKHDRLQTVGVACVTAGVTGRYSVWIALIVAGVVMVVSSALSEYSEVRRGGR